MVNVLDKINAFEQVVYYLSQWWKERNPEKENDLGILKVMKLLFFVSGADKENNLFDVFDNFQAWQYGHVEADIYNYYSDNKGEFSFFTINRFKLELK